MTEKRPTVADIRLKLEGQRNSLKMFVKSKEGEKAIAFLTSKYGGDVHKPGDPYATHVRIGERNVVDYLIALMGETTL